MTSALIALAMVASQGMEYPELILGESSPKETSVVCVIRAPQGMTGRDQLAWHVVMSGLLGDNTSYTAFDLRRYGGQAGIAPQVTWTSDYALIRFQQPPGALPVTLDLLAAMLYRPRFDAQEMGDRIAKLQLPQDPFVAALMGTRGADRVDTVSIRAAWNEFVSPPRVTLAIAPATEKEPVGTLVSERFGREPRRGGYGQSAGIHDEPFRTEPGAQVLVMRGPLLQPHATNAAPILALFALGVGKGSLAFQAVRLRAGLTYRQDGLLWPERDGWRPTLVFGGSAPLNSGNLRDTLGKAVDALTETDLRRAKALAQRCLEGDSPVNPFAFGPGIMYEAKPIDRLTWKALFPGGSTPEELGQALARVTLGELQQSAKAWVETAL